tara:strand:- start:1456 stop:2595 length:1140 start_codon:yes stop_codon:yes gene_type:complete
MSNEFTSWDDVNLKTELLRGIFAYGFEEPSTIQKKSILHFMERKDLIAQSQSGTGKTGAFVVGLLQNLKKEKKTQVLVMAPVRELAKQITEVVNSLGKFMSINTACLIGGRSTDKDIEILKTQTPEVVVGCPGRIFDMLKRKHLKTKDINCIIIDEADELLSSGFKEQVYNIFQYMNEDTQVCLFSATMPEELHELSTRFMRHPTKILIKQEELTLQGIAQFYIGLDNDEHKYATLKDLFGGMSMSQVIIYCNSIRRVDDLHEAMKHDNFPVEKIHGGMKEEERQKTYFAFKSGDCRVLISTDLLARGIDIQQVSIIINFDVPKSVHTYLHRIGRSGRWGRKGVGINFTTRRDFMNLNRIKEYYSTEIKELPSDYSSYL